MSDSLTTLISKVQNTLGDAAGTYFTTAIVTAAARQALREFNEACPIHEGGFIDTIANAKEYELADDLNFASMFEVTDVLLYDQTDDDHEPLEFDSYFLNNIPYIRLRSAQPVDEILLVRFTMPQTISGLDSETDSTIPANLDSLLTAGIAYYSIIGRGAGRIEANNLSKSTPDDYREFKETLLDKWTSGLEKLKDRNAPVGEPSENSWPIPHSKHDAELYS